MAAVRIKKRPRSEFLKQWQWQTMLLPGIVLLLVFSYAPMFGIIIAFKEYSVVDGILGSKFVGLKQFYDFFTDVAFQEAVRNTLGINLLNLLVGFPAPIILAILLNEISCKWFKSTTQTISYLPHFISWVIYGGLIIRLLSVDQGAVNDLLVSLKVIKEPVSFLGEPSYFWFIAVVTNVLKSMGYGAIIYLAAIAGISSEMVEASLIDGANRIQRIVYIIVPPISGTIVIFLILQVSSILSSGFDQIWMLQNAVNISMSEVIDTYVYKVGISSMRLSYAAAVGLLKSVIGSLLLVIANFIARRISGKGLF